MATYFSSDANAEPAAPTPSGVEIVCVTDPDQLMVSSRTEIVPGSLVFTLRRHPEQITANVWIHKLAITLPTGINPADLTDTPISINTFSGESTGRDLEVIADFPNRDRATFTVTAKDRRPFELKPGSSGNVISVTLGMVQINTEPGRVDIVCGLWTSTNGSGEGAPHSHTISVYKTDNSFFFRNLRPERMMVKPGTSVRIFWEASAHNTKLFLQRDIDAEYEVHGAYHDLANVFYHTGIKLRAETTIAGELVSYYQTCTVFVEHIFERRTGLSQGEVFTGGEGKFLHVHIPSGEMTLRYMAFGIESKIQLPPGIYFFPLLENTDYSIEGQASNLHIFEIWWTGRVSETSRALPPS